jgi:hypothetical protein
MTSYPSQIDVHADIRETDGRFLIDAVIVTTFIAEDPEDKPDQIVLGSASSAFSAVGLQSIASDRASGNSIANC